MGLFDKKYCDICGEKIGLLGNKKLEDANLCKSCASKLSPWFSGRRHSSLEDIRGQLAYREENRAAVSAFHTTRSLGRGTRVLLDEDARKFLVSSSGKLSEENPDVLDYAQVTGCDLDIEESRHERMQRDKNGNEVSFRPPRYDYSYNFYVVIRVNHPYFDEMRFRLNSSSVDTGSRCMSGAGGGARMSGFDGMASGDYYEYLEIGNEIKAALTQARQEIREEAAARSAPRMAVTCPWCGATTLPDANGCCEYCGGAVNA